MGAFTRSLAASFMVAILLLAWHTQQEDARVAYDAGVALCEAQPGGWTRECANNALGESWRVSAHAMGVDGAGTVQEPRMPKFLRGDLTHKGINHAESNLSALVFLCVYFVLFGGRFGGGLWAAAIAGWLVTTNVLPAEAVFPFDSTYTYAVGASGWIMALAGATAVSAVVNVLWAAGSVAGEHESVMDDVLQLGRYLINALPHGVVVLLVGTMIYGDFVGGEAGVAHRAHLLGAAIGVFTGLAYCLVRGQEQD